MERRQIIIQRIMNSMLHRQLLSSLLKWQHVMKTIKEKERKTMLAVKRWTSRLLCSSFRQWYDFIQEIRRTRRILKRTTLKMKRKKITAALAGWLWFCQVKKEKRNRMSCLLTRMCSANMTKGAAAFDFFLFSLFCCVMLKKRFLLHVLTHIWFLFFFSALFFLLFFFFIFFFFTTTLTHTLTHYHTGWQTWTSYMLAERVRENIESSKEYQQEREKEEKRRTLVRVMKRMIHSSLSTALLTWHHQAVHLKRVETLSRNISRRWRNVELHRSLNAWRASVLEQVQRRHGVARVHARWMLSSQSKSFMRWSQMVSDRTVARSLLSRMVRNFSLLFPIVFLLLTDLWHINHFSISSNFRSFLSGNHLQAQFAWNKIHKNETWLEAVVAAGWSTSAECHEHAGARARNGAKKKFDSPLCQTNATSKDCNRMDLLVVSCPKWERKRKEDKTCIGTMVEINYDEMSPSMVRESKRDPATSSAAVACHEENTSRTAGLVTAAVGGGDWWEERVAQESYSDGRSVDPAAAVPRFSAMEHCNECIDARVEFVSRGGVDQIKAHHLVPSNEAHAAKEPCRRISNVVTWVPYRWERENAYQGAGSTSSSPSSFARQLVELVWLYVRITTQTQYAAANDAKNACTCAGADVWTMERQCRGEAMAPSLDFACVWAWEVPQRPEVVVSLGGDIRF